MYYGFRTKVQSRQESVNLSRAVTFRLDKKRDLKVGDLHIVGRVGWERGMGGQNNLDKQRIRQCPSGTAQFQVGKETSY